MTLWNFNEEKQAWLILILMVALLAYMLYLSIYHPKYDCTIPFDNMTRSEIAYCYWTPPDDGV